MKISENGVEINENVGKKFCYSADYPLELYGTCRFVLNSI